MMETEEKMEVEMESLCAAHTVNLLTQALPLEGDDGDGGGAGDDHGCEDGDGEGDEQEGGNEDGSLTGRRPLR